MNFVKKLNKLNKLYSFQLFSITGWLIFILVTVFGSKFIQYANKSYEIGFILLIIIPIFLLLLLILAIIESIVGFKINNKFYTENKILKIVRFSGALIAFLYSGFLIFMLLKMILFN